MARRRKHEEHQNHEAWAIPYGDLITLLLAFFVVMYAISSVNAGKYRVLSDSLVQAFRGAPDSLDPVQTGATRLGGSPGVMRPLAAPVTAQPITPHAGDAPTASVVATPHDGAEGAAAIVPDAAAAARAAAAAAALGRVADAVENAMHDLIASNSVVVRRHDQWVEVELRTDVLFPSGAALLAPAAVPAIEKLADSLRSFPNAIRVEGHTDNRPISTALYPSNWELSAARAATVVQVLARSGVDPTRLAVLGMGEYRPVASNATAEGRNANRRVLLIIQAPGDAPEGGYAAQRGADAPAPASQPTPAAAPARPAATPVTAAAVATSPAANVSPVAEATTRTSR